MVFLTIPLVFNIPLRYLFEEAKNNIIAQNTKIKSEETSCDNGKLIHDADITTLNYRDIDCQQLCQVKHNYYKYKFVHKNDRVYVNPGVRLKPGGYCIPRTVDDCNLSINNVYLIDDKIVCTSKYPQLFEYNKVLKANTIVGCGGKIYDALANMQYVDTVPNANFSIKDIDERLPDNSNRYRITCSKTKNSLGTPLVERLNRFDLIESYCGSLIPNFDNGLIKNPQSGMCEIIDERYEEFKNYNNDKSMPLTTCFNNWAHENTNQGSQHALNIAHLCINESTPNLLIKDFVFPCVDDHKNCQMAPLLASTSYSPMTLDLLTNN